MPLLQVRDFPEDIYEEISFEAQKSNRTIAQQTIVLIKKGLGEEISNKERRRRLLEQLQNQCKPDLGGMDSVTVIREMREERTKAIMDAIEGKN